MLCLMLVSNLMRSSLLTLESTIKNQNFETYCDFFSQIDSFCFWALAKFEAAFFDCPRRLVSEM
jgi:hypothetical protein